MREENKKQSIISLGGKSPDTFSIDDREAERDRDFDDELTPAEQELALITDTDVTPMKFSEDDVMITPQK